jgi:outer membrane biosynthesis protein TonB
MIRGKDAVKPVVFLAVLMLIGVAAVYAQQMKAPTAASQSYPGAGIDMQYYDIREDTSSDEYLGYYKIIREKILQKLKGFYRRHRVDGDVRLTFTLDSGGRLCRYDVDRAVSTKDASLIDIAVMGLKSASPFPHFPPAITSPRITFNVIISFKDKL